MQLDLLNITLFMGVVSITFLMAVGLMHSRLSRSLRHRWRPPPLKHYPPLTVIRPIRGLDAGAEENIRAALRSGYPGAVETIFVFDDPRDPAYVLVERAISEDHGADRTRILFSGNPPAGRTGKLHAMIAGLNAARTDLVAFVDSDIRAEPRAMQVLVESVLGTKDAGSAFAPVVVAERPRTAGDAGYTLLLNGLYGPAAAQTADQNGGELPFIMGQFMIFRRAALEAIGGLQCAEGQLVDDMYLGAAVNKAGMHNIVSPHHVTVFQENLGLKEFISTYARWITFSRTGLPGWGFKMNSWIHGVMFWVGLLGGGLLAVLGLWAAALVMFFIPLTVSLSINGLHREMGGSRLPWRHRWISFGLLLMAPVIYARVLTQRRVTWRGRTYTLDAQARLDLGDVRRSAARHHSAESI